MKFFFFNIIHSIILVKVWKTSPVFSLTYNFFKTFLSLALTLRTPGLAPFPSTLFVNSSVTNENEFGPSVDPPVNIYVRRKILRSYTHPFYTRSRLVVRIPGIKDGNRSNWFSTQMHHKQHRFTRTRLI